MTVDSPNVPQYLVGTLKKSGKRPYVELVLPEIQCIPDGYKQKVDVQDEHGFEEGMLVMVGSIREHAHTKQKLVGVIEENLSGYEKKKLLRFARVLFGRDPLVAEDLLGHYIGSSLTPLRARARTDLCDLPFVTIDGPTSIVLDDAVFVKRLATGGWKAVVAIADVAEYVYAGDSIDQEAAQLGTSVYLPGCVVPLYPMAMIEDFCSLLPTQKRPAIVCSLEVSSEGTLVNVEMYEASVRSRMQLDYDSVEGFFIHGALENIEDEEVKTSLQELQHLTNKLKINRIRRGGLEFADGESLYENEYARTTERDVSSDNLALKAIAELMIFTNYAVANWVENRCQGSSKSLPPLFRVQAAPTRECLRDLVRAVSYKELDDMFYKSGDRNIRRVFADIVDSCRTSRMWLRDLREVTKVLRAEYSTTPNWHFGLALDVYMHFTSPLRRYSDLHNQRVVKKLLRDENSADSFLSGDEFANHQSKNALKGQQITHFLSNWLMCSRAQLIQNKKYTGVIVNLTEDGVYVDFDRYAVQGRIYVGDLHPEDRYVLGEDGLVGEATQVAFRIGDQVSAMVKNVNTSELLVDLALLGHATN